tara:strand:+ start:40 stop:579 length:540 start_codon:yes stop_codon:yes gene_type:complete
MQNALLLALFSFSIFLGTVFEFPIPGTTIMQTGQTIAVLCAGALLGPLLGAACVALYILLGVMGLPVFSEGASGFAVLQGASGGYLIGFIFAAALLGAWGNAGLLRNPLSTFVGLLLGHAIILVSGWLWMTVLMGSHAAYDNGVAPFYLGSTVKSVLATALLLIIHRILPVRHRVFSPQ